jgi:S-adenosylmethionine-diacylglycerol 3-amino-3-carboxypropyl transferase
MVAIPQSAAPEQGRAGRARSKAASLARAAHDAVFRKVHHSNLIYNTAWEDPRLDRQLMELDADSEVVMITSAGCNALDYLLDAPRRIHAIDMNPRQNALLNFKRALIRRGQFEDLFEMFGIGSHARHRELYGDVRARLDPAAQAFWDRRIGFFDPRSLKGSFYYHGTSGVAAWVMGKALFQARPNIKNFAMCLLEARTLEEQRQAYALLEPEIWGRLAKWLVRQPALMALLGVPRPQIRLIQDSYPGGLTAYVKDKLRHVLTELPAAENYFWRVYMTGFYTLTCCPNYLRREHQGMLREMENRVTTHTMTVSDFLRSHPGEYSHYVLLDHQDWLAWHDPEALREEWDLILANSRPGTKILMRSAGLDLSFLPPEVEGRVQFHPELTAPLHRLDRVGTYGSFHFGVVQS